MSRKLQSIYELFGYPDRDVDAVLDGLGPEDRKLIMDRYGEDLHNPVSKYMPKNDYKYFYNVLIPKIKFLLAMNKLERLKLIAEGISEDNCSKLLQFVSSDRTKKEMCEALQINEDVLYRLLLDVQNKGFTLLRKYYSDGTIKYRRVLDKTDVKSTLASDNMKTLITDKDENSLRLLVMSDLHFGNTKERIDLVNKVFEYCVKEGIHIILVGGDLIDGTFTAGEQRILAPYQQVKHFIDNYPRDDSIITFAVAGDHDFSAFHDGSLNMIEMLNNYRHDVVIGGYRETGINIKNDSIVLQHKIPGIKADTKGSIIFSGHSHKYTVKNSDPVSVAVPSISNIGSFVPSALVVSLDFSRGYISHMNIRQLGFFDGRMGVLGQVDFNVSKGNNPKGTIKNTESLNPTVDTEKPKEETVPLVTKLSEEEREVLANAAVTTEEKEEEPPKVMCIRHETQREKFYRRYSHIEKKED